MILVEDSTSHDNACNKIFIEGEQSTGIYFFSEDLLNYPECSKFDELIHQRYLYSNGGFDTLLDLSEKYLVIDTFLPYSFTINEKYSRVLPLLESTEYLGLYSYIFTV